MALAIIDDLGAIIIIALFYSGHDMHFVPLYYALGAMGVLFLLNVGGIKNLFLYLLVGLVLWVCVV